MRSTKKTLSGVGTGRSRRGWESRSISRDPSDTDLKKQDSGGLTPDRTPPTRGVVGRTATRETFPTRPVRRTPTDSVTSFTGPTLQPTASGGSSFRVTCLYPSGPPVSGHEGREVGDRGLGQRGRIARTGRSQSKVRNPDLDRDDGTVGGHRPRPRGTGFTSQGSPVPPRGVSSFLTSLPPGPGTLPLEPWEVQAHPEVGDNRPLASISTEGFRGARPSRGVVGRSLRRHGHGTTEKADAWDVSDSRARLQTTNTKQILCPGMDPLSRPNL